VFHRILVAIDNSDARHRTIQAASELARPLGASLHVVHIATSAITPQALVELEDDATAQKVLDEAVASARDAGAQADGELLTGLNTHVAISLSEAAERFGADLIVLSPHHRGPVEALFSPRVSDGIAHSGKFAVLLLPEATEA
jgi:nucleotide-binding universal stress UspA family protein